MKDIKEVRCDVINDSKVTKESDNLEEVIVQLNDDGAVESDHDPLNGNTPITKVINTNYYLGDRISPSSDLCFTASMFSTYIQSAFKEQDSPVEVYVTNAEEYLAEIDPIERVGYVEEFSINTQGQVVAEIAMENEDLYNKVIGRRRIVTMFEFEFQRRVGVMRDITKISKITLIPEIDRYYTLLKRTLDSIVVEDLQYIRHEDVIAQIMKRCMEDLVYCGK